MVKAKSELTWVEIDIEALDESLRTPYELYKKAYKEMKALREAFEQDMNDAHDLPDGKRLVFGYNFGKLSVAVADKVVEKAKAQGKQSLGDWLKTQANSGRRV